MKEGGRGIPSLSHPRRDASCEIAALLKKLEESPYRLRSGGKSNDETLP